MIFFTILFLLEAHMKWSAVLSAAVLSVLMAPSAWSGFYRWVDRDGREFYTNDIAKIPAEYREKASPVATDEGRVSIGDVRSASAKRISVSEHKDIKGRGEAYWREREQTLRRKIAKLQDEYDVILRQEREQKEKERNSIQPKKRMTGKSEKKRLSIEKKLATLKRELEIELPEEVRKAGAYPGWIRE